VRGGSQGQPPQIISIPVCKEMGKSVYVFFHLLSPGNQDGLYGSARLIPHGDPVTDRWLVLRRFYFQDVLARGNIVEVIHAVKSGKGGGGEFLIGISKADLDVGSRRNGSGRPLIIHPPFHIATIGKIRHG